MREFAVIREALDAIEAEMNRRDILLEQHASRVAGLYLDTIKTGQQQPPPSQWGPWVGTQLRADDRVVDDRDRRDFVALYDAVSRINSEGGDLDALLDRWASHRANLGEQP